MFHKITKHIDVDRHFVREAIIGKQIKIPYTRVASRYLYKGPELCCVMCIVVNGLVDNI